MRTIVYGVGAIGGTVAAALALSGQEVVGIARGAQLAAVRAGGLLLRTPEASTRARFPCVADPEEIAFGPDDAILLTMKTQDTPAALERLRAAGVAGQPIFCVQNAVANERMALRHFASVHGVTVMMPASFVTPGEVVVTSSPRYGIFDIGRYPAGSDADDARLAAALDAAERRGLRDGRGDGKQVRQAAPEPAQYRRGGAGAGGPRPGASMRCCARRPRRRWRRPASPGARSAAATRAAPR